MRKIRYSILFILAILVFLSVPVFFMGFYNSFGKIIAGTLGIKINPVLSGGEVMAVFKDEAHDDKGTGSFTYPQAEAYRPYKGHLDLIQYIVKKPVHNGTRGYKDFWAVELVLGSIENPLNAPAGFSFPVINLYISVNGAKGGRLDAFLPGANVAFDPGHPWHYFIRVHGWVPDGKLYNHKGEEIGRVLVDIIKKTKDSDKKLRITIPIEKAPELMLLKEKDATYHYVIIGSYDPVESENFRAISQAASSAAGGGNPAPGLAPRIYDYLAPEGESQYAMLSGYDAANRKYAVLKPVKVVIGK